MATSVLWEPATSTPRLAENELHVWRASLDLPNSSRRRLESTLDTDEKKRAERFLVPQTREHFLAARGILRELLGMYLGVSAAKVGLTYGPQGKPALSPAHNSRISFNLSHSDGMGLFAFAMDREVGIDIERVRMNFQGVQIASHFFSDSEKAALAKLPPECAEESFFACWTRKEAYVKAHGEGLGIALQSFTVQFAEREQALRDERGTPWSCYALDPAIGFAGAVVAAGENWRLRCWEWAARLEKFEASTVLGNA